MRVFITGGAGMVGSHAAEFYAQKGHEVIVFDNLMRSRLFGYDKKSVEFNWNYLEKYQNIKKIVGDIRNSEDLKKALSKDIGVVIHTAGQPGVDYSIKDPEEDYSINAFGTFNVLEHIRNICPSAVFIYCSTNKVYGENVSKLELLEEERRYSFKGISGIPEGFGIDLTSHTPYGVSKYIGDMYAQEYADTYGIKAGIFRMSCIYGTRQFGFEDQGWLAHFIISNIMKRPITVYGDGKQVRDVLFVKDLIQAFNRFIESNLKTEVFNIGGGGDNTISLLEFIDIIESKTRNKMAVSYDKWRPSDQKVYISDINKIGKTMGWKPSTSVSAGIDALIEWVTSHQEFFK